MFKVAKIRIFLIVILTTVAISRPIFHIFDDHPWRDRARLSGVAPLPLVFTARNGIEPWAIDVVFTLSFERKRTKEFRLSPNIFSMTPGNHFIRLVLTMAFGNSRRDPLQTWKLVTEKELCQKGFMYEMFDLDSVPKSVKVRSTNLRDRSLEFETSEYFCKEE